MSKIKCETCKTTFEKYAEQMVLWSDKTEPCCPQCGTTIYQGAFQTVKKAS